MPNTTPGSLPVSVVIPVHNSAQYVERCIGALLDQSLPPAQFEVLVVDNNSTDRSAELVRRYEPGVRFLREDRQGAYAARNRGIRAARGRVIAFTDPDCIPDRQWLRQALNALSAGADVVLGRNDLPTAATSLGLLALYEHHKNSLIFSGDTPKLYHGRTNNMAVTRRTLERCGPFVERPRGADTIFVRAVVETLGTCAVSYWPDMRVVHMEVDSTRVYFQKAFTYASSRQQYRHIARTHPLSSRARLGVFRHVVEHEDLTSWEAAYLWGLLTIGVGYWTAGTVAGLTPHRPLSPAVSSPVAHAKEDVG